MGQAAQRGGQQLLLLRIKSSRLAQLGAEGRIKVPPAGVCRGGGRAARAPLCCLKLRRRQRALRVTLLTSRQLPRQHPPAAATSALMACFSWR